MKTRVRAFGLCALGLWALASVAVACGSDDDAKPPASEVDGSAPVPPAPGGDASANAADVTVFTRTTATLDASSSRGSAFAWSLKAAPPGSAVTTAAIQGAATAHASFVPDVSGDYTLEVKVTDGSVTSAKDVLVKAVPAPVFYQLVNFDAKNPYYEVRTVGMDGTGAHAVTCRQQAPGDAGSDDDDPAGGLLFLAMIAADTGIDWWEAPPGQPSRAAFQEYIVQSDGGDDDVAVALAVGTTASTCQSPPKVVHVVPSAAAGDDSNGIFQPRFSPDGSRIAYIEQRGDEYLISVVGADGKDYRELAPVCPVAAPDDTCWTGDAFFPPRPQWLDAKTVVWARATAAAVADDENHDGWEVMVATDSANPAPHLYMTCDGIMPLGILPLKDGSIVANRRPVGAAADLFVLKPPSPGGACQLVRKLTNLPNERSYARDFSLSPDGKTLAFLRHVSANNDAGALEVGGELYKVPVDGSSKPAPFTSPVEGAAFGPRYVAGGAFVAFNGIVPIPDGGLAEAGLDDAGTDDLDVFDGGMPAIKVVPAQGGKVTIAAASDVGARTFTLGGGNGGGCGFGQLNCALSGGTTSGGAGVLAFAALFVLRRRNRRREDEVA